MKTVTRNLFSILRRFKTATTLNVLGLSVAFAAFIVIMKQIDYDRTFDTADPNHERIFRMEFSKQGNIQGIICRPLAELFFNSSPHILAGTLTSPWHGKYFFYVESDNVRHSHQERFIPVSPEFTDVFTFDFVEGTKEDFKKPGGVMIPLSLARKLFGDASAVGKLLLFSNTSLTVAAVYRDIPSNSLVENAVYTQISPEENKHNWSNWNYPVYIRLDRADALPEIVDNFVRNFDENIFKGSNISYDKNDIQLRFTALPEIHYTTDVTYDFTPKASRQTLLVLFAIGIIMIAIAGINFTNFSTALTPMRIRSINTQKVLGGTTATIRRSLLFEAILMASVAFLLSLVIIHLFAHTAQAQLVEADLSLTAHPNILIGTALMPLFTGLAAGIYPAFYMTSFPPALVLKGNFGLSPRGRSMRNVLIGIQFIASFALIMGAMFMNLQNYYMQHSPLGYDKEALIVSDLNYKLAQKIDALTTQLKTDAAIDGVSFGRSLLSSSDQYMGWGRNYKDRNISFQCLPVEWSFLKVAGIEVSDGRDFRIEDSKTKYGAYIFNEKARAMYEMELGTAIDSSEIVGFMPDIKFASFRTEVVPMAFYVWGTKNWGMPNGFIYVKVKTGSDMRAAIDYVRKTLASFDPEYPFNVRFYDQVLQHLYEKESALSSLIMLFSAMAIFISIVGVFGLVVFDCEYRKKEIGIRKVFGSTTRQILLMFNKTYFRIISVCFIIALPISYYFIVKWLENFAYKTPLYWWVFVLSFGAVALVTLATVSYQNWRAANANPVESIRSE